MQQFQEWYLSMDFTQQLFWGCAIVATVIFMIQTTLTMLGIDGDMDFNVDPSAFDGDTTDFGGLSLFSIRSMINFFVGFGWAGVCFHGIISSIPLLYAVSTIIGIGFGSLWFIIRRKMNSLEKNGAYSITDAVGKTCDVYLRIPAGRKGTGKIQISLKGSIHELAAMTDGDAIATGTKVSVLSVIDSSTVLVTQA